MVVISLGPVVRSWLPWLKKFALVMTTVLLLSLLYRWVAGPADPVIAPPSGWPSGMA